MSIKMKLQVEYKTLCFKYKYWKTISLTPFKIFSFYFNKLMKQLYSNFNFILKHFNYMRYFLIQYDNAIINKIDSCIRFAIRYQLEVFSDDF